MSKSNVVILLRLRVLVFFCLQCIVIKEKSFLNAFTAVSKSINVHSYLVERRERESDNPMPFYYLCRNERIKSSSRIVCWMAKGDGKKSRKKQTQSQPQPSNVKPVATTPQRVTNDINIPVRRQIKWAQMKKEALRNSGTSFRQTNVKRTAYRKSLGRVHQIVVTFIQKKELYFF